MKVKIQLAPARAAIALLAAATGCASHNENIVFTDTPDIHTAMVSAASPASQLRLEKEDELKIERVIFGYLLDRHFWDLADYSAVFLQADDAQVKAMIKKFPDHVPPIKYCYHAIVQPHKTPLDADTYKPAMILSADVNEPNPDGSVDAVGRWYAGDAVTGFRAFHLEKAGDDWQITEAR